MISGPLKTNKIDLLDIEQLLAMRDAQRALKDRLGRLETSLEAIEGTLIALIEGGGADLSAIPYAVEVKRIERRYPHWKQIYIEIAGSKAAADILEQTSPTVSKTLLIKAA